MNFEQFAAVSVRGKPTSSLGSEPLEPFTNDESLHPGAAVSQPPTRDTQLHPEGLVEYIKKVAEEGIFKVRFERNKVSNEIVINLVDQKTGEVIRKIPSEEILGLHAALADLRGNIIETKT